MYQLCLLLAKGSLYCLFDLFFFFKMTIIKAIKEVIQNNTKVYSLFVRTHFNHNASLETRDS